MNHVPKDKKEETINWLSKQGCKDEITTVKVLTKWTEETLNKKQTKDNNIGRGE